MMSTIDALFFCFIVLSGTNSTVAIKLSVNDKMYFTNKFSAVFYVKVLKGLTKSITLLIAARRNLGKLIFGRRYKKATT